MIDRGTTEFTGRTAAIMPTREAVLGGKPTDRPDAARGPGAGRVRAAARRRSAPAGGHTPPGRPRRSRQEVLRRVAEEDTRQAGRTPSCSRGIPAGRRRAPPGRGIPPAGRIQSRSGGDPSRGGSPPARRIPPGRRGSAAPEDHAAAPRRAVVRRSLPAAPPRSRAGPPRKLVVGGIGVRTNVAASPRRPSRGGVRRQRTSRAGRPRNRGEPKTIAGLKSRAGLPTGIPASRRRAAMRTTAGQTRRGRSRRQTRAPGGDAPTPVAFFKSHNEDYRRVLAARDYGANIGLLCPIIRRFPRARFCPS